MAGLWKNGKEDRSSRWEQTRQLKNLAYKPDKEYNPQVTFPRPI